MERTSDSAHDAARALVEQARGLIEAADRSGLPVEPPEVYAVRGRRLARRLGRAADVLRGADDLDDTQTLEDAVDRERLRAALIAGVVLTALSLFVFIIAREIANRRTTATPDPGGQEERYKNVFALMDLFREIGISRVQFAGSPKK
jgi:hypothetical protein